MMRGMGEEDAWAPLAGRFVDGHYGSLRGYVRTHVIDRHLREHVAHAPAAVVDVGGGAGHQSIPLARDGYDVTIIDPSPAMLERARGALRREDRETAARVRLVQSTGEAAAGKLGGQRFDVVLCHGVVMYLDDPGPMLDALVGLSTPGGVVSIVAKNVEALAVRPALEGEWATALRMFDSERDVNGLGLETRADSVGGLSAELERRGVEPLGWYGVRLFTDGWTPDRPADDPEADVLAVELEASRRDPYRRLSRLFHIVGRKATSR